MKTTTKRKRITPEVRSVRKTQLFKRLEAVLRDHRGDCMVDDETALVDVLADLRHVADKQRVDWAGAVSRANNHHGVEAGLREELREKLARDYECQNCGGTYPESGLVTPIPDLEERVAPGESMPAGECPVCGALCHAKGER
jgi:hypothetical protein